LRIPGFIAASLFVLVAILGNTLASEEADFKSPSEVLSLLLIAGVWMALVAAVTARKDRV
jgi:hypothetical protein